MTIADIGRYALVTPALADQGQCPKWAKDGPDSPETPLPVIPPETDIVRGSRRVSVVPRTEVVLGS